MGLDFIYARAKSFIRGWDRKRHDLAVPDLFANAPTLEPRTCTATPAHGMRFEEGQDYIVTPHGPHLRVTNANELVGIVKAPPPSITEKIQARGSSIALGRVERIHPISRVADLTIR